MTFAAGHRFQREKERFMKRTLVFLASLVVIGLPVITWGQDQYPQTQQPTSTQNQNTATTPTTSTTTTTDVTADPALPHTASDLPLVAASGMTLLGLGLWLSRRRRA
jgi:LPXTG-motif cell wall-anchored protein